MTKYLPFGENLVKIRPVDPEITGWEVRPLKYYEKIITLAEHIARGTGMLCGLNNRYVTEIKSLFHINFTLVLDKTSQDQIQLYYNKQNHCMK